MTVAVVRPPRADAPSGAVSARDDQSTMSRFRFRLQPALDRAHANETLARGLIVDARLACDKVASQLGPSSHDSRSFARWRRRLPGPATRAVSRWPRPGRSRSRAYTGNVCAKRNKLQPSLRRRAAATSGSRADVVLSSVFANGGSRSIASSASEPKAPKPTK